MSNGLSILGLTTGHIANIAVLHDIDLQVSEGEVLGLMGRNGAGKSTLAAAIAGILPCWAGRLKLNGWDCTRAAPRERILRGLVAVPENRRLFGQLTVLENLRVAAFGAKREFTAALREEIEAQFPIVGRKAKTRCSVLSGGEQQMVALARARVMAPKFLVLDEPSLGLAPAVTSQLAEVIRRFAKDGVGVILIEQNVALVEKVCDVVKLLDEGHFVGEVATQELSGREDIAAAYLGVPVSLVTAGQEGAAPVPDGPPIITNP